MNLSILADTELSLSLRKLTWDERQVTTLPGKSCKDSNRRDSARHGEANQSPTPLSGKCNFSKRTTLEVQVVFFLNYKKFVREGASSYLDCIKVLVAQKAPARVGFNIHLTPLRNM